MGNRRLYKVERFHARGVSESEWLKVAALNLFHPTASPSFPKNRFFHIATQSPEGEGDLIRGFSSGISSLLMGEGAGGGERKIK